MYFLKYVFVAYFASFTSSLCCGKQKLKRECGEVKKKKKKGYEAF